MIRVTNRLSPPSDDQAAERERLVRRLDSWLASQPAPVDIIDSLYRVARCLEDSVPGGLRTAGADILLDVACQVLFYCDQDDFLAVWPVIRAGQR